MRVALKDAVNEDTYYTFGGPRTELIQETRRRKKRYDPPYVSGP